MIRLNDGPAAGVNLMLRRAPLFLRVVKGRDWDALDQLTDTPAPTESVTVYRRVGKAGAIHILCARGKNGRNATGWYAYAEYQHHPEQPGDDVTRDTMRWREWCAAQANNPTVPQ